MIYYLVVFDIDVDVGLVSHVVRDDRSYLKKLLSTHGTVIAIEERAAVVSVFWYFFLEYNLVDLLGDLLCCVVQVLNDAI